MTRFKPGTPSPGLTAMAFAAFGRPQLLLRFFAFSILGLALGAVVLMLQVPLVSVDAEMGANGTIILFDGEKSVTVPGASVVTFRSILSGEVVRLQAALLPGVAEPRGSRAENQIYWAERDRLASMATAGPVDVEAGTEQLRSGARKRFFSDLTIGFWLSLTAGAIAALTGLWVWILRPRAWAPIMFALSGTGLFVGCATIALNISPGLGFSGRLDHIMLVANYLSGVVCAGSLVALFARFPQPLVSPFWLWLLAIVSVAIAIDVAFDLLPNAVDVAILSAGLESVAIIVLLALQTWYARHDPDTRAALMPITIGTAVSVILFLVLSLAGQFNGETPLVSPDMTAPLLSMLYLGLGVAIIRARLFALGRWALSMLLSACAILFLLVVDAILLATVTQQRDLALFLSAMAGITVYLPMREWLLRRTERLRDGQARDLLQFAGDMALAPTPELAHRAWSSAALAMFDPLEAETIAFYGDEPKIMDSGSALYFPSPMADEGMMLRFPGGGTRIFEAGDIDTALQFAGLVRRLLDAREAYLRGVTEERGRIARDLHDDVSARLLTSLHRPNAEATYEDVRGAMADIRTIITGLSGTPQSFEAMLANLRHETQGRLEAAGVKLDWPIPAAMEEHWSLDYSTGRQIVSIVRECVTNIIRHADARSASVRVHLVEGRLIVEICDDGRGIVEGQIDGNGLANAARRAASVGGAFAIASNDRGTQAHLSVPISPQEMPTGSSKVISESL